MQIKEISSNTLWLVGEKGVRSVMTLLVGAAVIRYLGPDQYGQMAYVIAIIAFFQAVASIGIDSILIREIIDRQNKNIKVEQRIIKVNAKDSIKNNGGFNNYNNEIAELITTALILRTTFGIFLLGSCLLLTGYVKDWNTEYLKLAFLLGGVLIFQAADVIDVWNQSQLNSKRTAIIKIISYFASNGLKLYLIKVNAELVWFAFAVFLEVALIGIILYLTHINTFYLKIKIHQFNKIALALVSETWPLMISALLAATYTKFDQLVLEKYHGEIQLGVYNAAILFATATYFLPIILCSTLMPIITVAKNKSQSEYIKKLRLVYAVLALTGIFAFIITSASAPFIIGLLYGDTFNQGSTILAIYAFSNIPGYIGVAHGIWMVNDKKIKLSIYRSTAGAITCIFLSLSLIPKYGIIGAAISTIFALIVSDIVVPIILNIKLFNQIVNFKNSTIK